MKRRSVERPWRTGQELDRRGDMRMMKRTLAALAVAGLASGMAAAQSKSTTESIEEYRAMLADGNPAELFEAKGEALWKSKRGPKNASLEQCDLGKGPGRGQGRVRRAAALVCRYRQGAGPRIAPGQLHGAPAGLRRQRDRQDAVRRAASRPTSRRWRPGSRPNRRAWPSTCRSRTRRRRWPTKWASACSSCAAAPTTSPAPPATARTASASACRTCPT